MKETVIGKIEAALAQSELLLATASVKLNGGMSLALEDTELRALHPQEIEHLEAQGNMADDWSRVRVADGFDWRRVHHSSFHGDVVLGRFDWWTPVTDGLQLRSGVYHATVADCVIGHDALVRDVRLLANYIVGRGALLLDCGRITCEPTTSFGNGAVLPVGIESGGRDIAVYAEIDIDTATTIARCRGQNALLECYAEAVAQYAAQACCGRGIIEHHAVIRHTHEICNSYVGPYAEIDGATGVRDSTLLSNDTERVRIESGACVRGALLQWGSRVSTLAIVDHSVLSEYSYVERHAKVTNSILGPNSGIAEGEVTSSLIGPFVGFHHQALLIATLWPEGKGNVGHGASAGSNHTGKAPDQELWLGEGTFLGLGVNIKFPTNLSHAPYSMIACGVTMLPQRIEFPFSLVNTPSLRLEGMPGGFQEIFPAWVLANNLYTLKRNEVKFAARNRARRTSFTFDVFRPEIIDLMRDACRRLEKVPVVQQCYTESEIPGLGKNYLFEPRRQEAIATYRFFIMYYALMGLKIRLEKVWRKCPSCDPDQVLLEPSNCPRWEQQRHILYQERGVADVVAGLRLLPAMLEKIAHDVERSKARDDERGSRIIDDYAVVHTPAVEDKFVQHTCEETSRLIDEVRHLIAEVDDHQMCCGSINAMLPEGAGLPQVLIRTNHRTPEPCLENLAVNGQRRSGNPST